MKTLLIVYHTHGVKTAKMAEAVERGAGQDGAGAVTSVERIVAGLRLEKKSEPIVGLKELTPEILEHCEQLGAAFAAGLALGVF